MRTRLVGRSLSLLAVAAAICSVATVPALADAGGQSVAYQLDPAHDGYASGVSLAPPLKEAWSRTLSGGVSYPLVVGGTVYVSAAAGSGTNVYALDLASGSVVWEHAIGGTYPWSGIAYDNTGSGGRIFVVNSSGLLTALDAATGTAVWSSSLPGQYSFSSPPTAVNGVVYDGGAGSGGTLYATDENTGALLWSQPVANGDHSSPAVDGSNVYATYPDNYYAFDRTTGAPVWQDYLGGDGGGGRTPVVADGHLFIRDWAASPLIVSSASGATQGPLGSTTAPAIAAGSAYEMTGAPGSGTLQAVGSDGLGATRWSFAGDGHLSSAPLVTGDTVWAGSTSGQLYELSTATGTVLWSTDVGSPIEAPDEQNVSAPLTGLGAGSDTLVVPAGPTLAAYISGGATPAAPASSSTNPPAPTPSWQAREAAMLRRELVLHTTVSRLLAHHGMTVKVTALRPGRLALAWAFARAGHRTRHPLVIAVAGRVKRAGTARLRIRLNKRGMRALRRMHHRLAVTGAAELAPRGGRAVKVRRSFQIAA